MNETELATVQQPLEALPYRPLFATVSGAHLYGFASPDQVQVAPWSRMHDALA